MALAMNSRLIRAAARRVLPAPVAISTGACGGLLQLAAQGVDAVFLIVAPSDTVVDRHGERVLPQLARSETPFQVRLFEEGFTGWA